MAIRLSSAWREPDGDIMEPGFIPSPFALGGTVRTSLVRRVLGGWRIRLGRTFFRRDLGLVALLFLSACAPLHLRGGYAKAVLDRPLPVSEADRQAECAWIRYEMGRQQEIVTQRAIFAEGREAVMNRVNFEQNLMVLESRARAVPCNE